MPELEIRKKAQVVGHYDVVVCGGGPAGFIAALASARLGAKTALIEQYGFLGGMATAGLVMPLSVFTYSNELVIGGLPWEFVKRLETLGGAHIEYPLGNVAFEPELYKLCCQQMLLEAGVDLYLHSYITDCICTDKRVDAVVFENKNGCEALQGNVFVDATGDADLAHLMGVEMQSMNGEALQPLSMYFVLSGVDTQSELVSKAMHHNQQGVNCHCLPVREKFLELGKDFELDNWGGPWFCTVLHEGVVAVNMTRRSADACNNRNYTQAECELREDVFKAAEALRKYVPEFRNCYVSQTSPQAGIRETRRIKGVHTISADEYLNAVEYPDTISRGAHPIDIHSNQSGSQGCRFLEKPANVPYRSLITSEWKNLIVGGRCISADRQAFASLRVQASCMGTGQAAGVASALCALQEINVQSINVEEIQNVLKKWGATI